MATPLAYAAGVLCQIRRPGEEKRSPEETAFGLLLGVIALGLGATAWFGDWPAEQAKVERVQAPREIDAGAVTALRVSREVVRALHAAAIDPVTSGRAHTQEMKRVNIIGPLSSFRR